MIRLPVDRSSRLKLLTVLAFLVVFALGTRWVANRLDWETEIFELRDAVVRGDVDAVKRLEGDGVDWRDLGAYDEEFSALHRAARNGRMEMVRYLVENGADVAAANTDGDTPLVLAVEREHTDVVAYLTEQTYTPDTLERLQDTRIVEPPFLKRLAQVEGVTFSLPPIVAYAALPTGVTEDDEAFVAFLLRAGTPAGMTTPPSDEGFANHSAMDGVYPRWLASYGAEAATTPLHMAAQLGNERITQLLLDYGGNPTAVDQDGMSPMDYAVQEGHVAVENLLITHNQPGL